MEMFLVGGAVRDMVMGRSSKDWDFTVVMTEEESRPFDPFSAMVDVLTNAMDFEIFLSDPAHMTVRARAPKGWTFAGMIPPVRTFDFVLARRDVSTDGRHAVTEPGTLFDDLARRDFTMNAIAMDSSGNLIDPFDGATAIEHMLIETVGDATDRFEEDGLRVLRAIRFAITLGFDFSGSLDAAMDDNPARWLGKVSVERVREELHKAFAANTSRTIRMLSEHDMVSSIFHGGDLWLMPTTKGR
jgi:tRNA nucleotidyltransferase (CCA-adding enzyme)